MFTRKIKKWLEDMARRNEENLGNQRLDCCNLNQPKNSVAKTDKSAAKQKSGTVQHRA